MKLKKILAAAVSACMLSCAGFANAVSVRAFDPPSALFTADTVTCCPGDIVPYSITLSDMEYGNDSDMLAFKLSYDAPLEIVKTNFSDDVPMVTYGDTGCQEGTLGMNITERMIGYNSGILSEPIKDGTVMTLYFLVPEDAEPDTYKVKVDEAFITRQDQTTPQPLTYSSGSIKVEPAKGTSGLKLQGDRITVRPGEKADYNVYLFSNPGYDSIGIFADLDDSFTLDTNDSGKYASPGIAAGDCFLTEIVNTQENIVTFRGALQEGAYCSDSGELMTLSVNVPENAETGYYPVWIKGGMNSLNGEILDINSIQGWIKVSNEPDVLFSADQIEAAPGETIRYTIRTAKNPGYDQISMVLSFDPSFTVRKESSVANGAYTVSGPAALTGSNVGSLNQTKGTIAFADAGKLKNTTGELFSFYLTIPENAEEGAYPVVFTDCAAKSGSSALVTSGEPGYIKVVKKLKGDVNSDKQVNIADAVLLQKWLLAKPDAELADWKSGDLCKDDKLNVFDLCLLKELITEQK